MQELSPNDSRQQLPLEQLLADLQDLERPLHKISLESLSDPRQTDMERFQDAWASLPSVRRRRLVAALVELAEDHIEVNFGRIFRWLLTDQDPWIRVQALEGLWEDEDVRLISPLVQLLERDPEPDVQAEAAISLGRFLLLGELNQIDNTLARSVEQALVAVLIAENRDVQVRRRALESLAYLTEEWVQGRIRLAYQDEDESMRLGAVFAMGRSADRCWRDDVLNELSSRDRALRFEAARASGELELAEAVPGLIQMLEEDDIELRDTAVWALGRIGGPAARRALEACCVSTDEELREAAEDALAELEFMAGDDELPGFGFAI